MSIFRDDNPVMDAQGITRDPLCVCGRCFSPVLQGLFDAYDRLRPPDSAATGGLRDQYVPKQKGDQHGNRGVIAVRSGVHMRKIHGYLKEEWPTVGLRDADALFVAFDRVDLLQEFVVYRRQWNVRCPKHRHACEVLPAVDESVPGGSRADGDSAPVGGTTSLKEAA